MAPTESLFHTMGDRSFWRGLGLTFYRNKIIFSFPKAEAHRSRDMAKLNCGPGLELDAHLTASASPSLVLRGCAGAS